MHDREFAPEVGQRRSEARRTPTLTADISELVGEVDKLLRRSLGGIERQMNHSVQVGCKSIEAAKQLKRIEMLHPLFVYLHPQTGSEIDQSLVKRAMICWSKRDSVPNTVNTSVRANGQNVSRIDKFQLRPRHSAPIVVSTHDLIAEVCRPDKSADRFNHTLTRLRQGCDFVWRDRRDRCDAI